MRLDNNGDNSGKNTQLLLGNCLDRLRELADNSVDSVVCDPPYGLSFMGKAWDYDVPGEDIWRECLRVLKPGGHLLAFFGTRTYHRGVVKIEDAGFEIRDQIQWLYGSGFPKSMDISKAIDKAAGVEREVIGVKPGHEDFANRKTAGHLGQQWERPAIEAEGYADKKSALTAPATDAAKQWQGWGTALKPANEPIVVARKPISEKTVAANVLKHGTGGINVDGCRVEVEDREAYERNSTRVGEYKSDGVYPRSTDKRESYSSAIGRWPANLILDEHAAAMLDEQTQHLHGAGSARGGGKAKQYGEGALFGMGNHDGNGMRFGDSGGASRFFYVAKASKAERNAGLEHLPDSKLARSCSAIAGNEHEGSGFNSIITTKNNHPTVKPIKLMTYLVRLVTPLGGTVLDPFMGSGTTGVAAIKEGFRFIGIELDPNYFEIAQERIAHHNCQSEPMLIP